MAGSVSFKLRKPNEKTETPVNVVFYYYDKQILLSTGERIKPKNWNPKTHKARETQKDYKNFNTRLENIKGDVMNTVRDHLSTNGKVFLDILKKELAEVVKPKPQTEQEQKPKNLIDFVQRLIDTTDKKPNTKKSYRSAKTVLKGYQDHSKKVLTFEGVDLDFYFDFIDYLTNVKKFSKNTIGDNIKKVKAFMNHALDKGYTDNRAHQSRKFNKPEETAETIYLNDDELKTLYEKDLTDNKKLDRVRDLFLIGCYTGLRFSDLTQLTPDKFIKNGTQLRVKTIKTGEMVVIPLHWIVKEILKKYNGTTPRPISNQKMNVYLKELGETAELNEKIILNRTKGGLSYDQTKEKYTLITVHTARRSFATNMYLAEVPTISIMKITGHKTDTAFMKYIKITQEQNADKLSVHPYFTKSPLKKVVNHK